MYLNWMPAGTEAHMNLRQRAAVGAKWTAMATVATTCIRFVQLGILARLLEPADFGLMAIIAIVIGFAQMFEHMGLAEAVIQRARPTNDELSSLYWLNVCAGLVAFLLVLAVTPAVSWAFGEIRLKSLLPVVAASLLVQPLGALFHALMRKELHFGIGAVVNVAVNAVGAAVAVSTAWWLHQGVWSLVWGSLAGTITHALLGRIYGAFQSIHIRWHFAREDLRGYLRFGTYYVASMTANFFNSRVDQIFIGVVLGPQALGYYKVASQLTTETVQKINPVLTRVAFPVLSRVSGDMLKLRSGYLQLMRLVTLINAPLFLGLAVVAPVAVPLVLGEQWRTTVPLVQILSIYAFLRSLGNATGSLILAAGRTDWSFRWNVAMLAVAPPLIYLAGQSGDVEVIAWSLVVLQLLLFWLAYRLITRKIVGACLPQYLKAVGTPTLLASTMALATYLLGHVISSGSDIERLFLLVLAGAIVYLCLLWFFQRAFVKGLYASLKTPT